MKIYRKVVVFVKSFFSDKGNVALVLILLVAAALRFYKLGEQSFWYDEMVSVVYSQRGFSYISSLKSPLTYLFIYFELLFGNSEFIIRIYSAIFGVLGVAIFYLVTKRLFDKRTALLSGLFLALNTFHVLHSQDARFYAVLTFSSLLSIYFLVRALEERSLKFWLSFFVSIIFSIITHQTALFFILAEIVFLVFLAGWYTVRGRSWGCSRWLVDRRMTITVAVFGVLLVGILFKKTLPLALIRNTMSAIQTRALRSYPKHFDISLKFLQYLFYNFLAAHAPRVDFTAVFLGVVSFFLLGLANLAKRSKSLFSLVCCWFVIPVAAVAVAKPSHFFAARYFIFYLPILLMLLARGIVVCGEIVCDLVSKFTSLQLNRYKMCFVLVSLPISLYFYILPTIPCLRYYYNVWWRPDCRGIGEYLQDNYAEGDIIAAERSIDSLISIPYYLSKAAGGGSIASIPEVQNHLDYYYLTEATAGVSTANISKIRDRDSGEGLQAAEFTLANKYRIILSEEYIIEALTNSSGVLWFVSSRNPVEIFGDGVVVEDVYSGGWHIYKVMVPAQSVGACWVC